MSLPLRKLLTLPLLLTILSASSCGTNRPKFYPDAYRANHHIEAIVNAKEDVVYCYEERFSEFACMNKQKWEELRRLIQELQIDPSQKLILLKSIEHALKKE